MSPTRNDDNFGLIVKMVMGGPGGNAITYEDFLNGKRPQ